MEVALEGNESGHISIALADDTTVQELNAKFRGLDEVTDVLSFSTDHPGHWQSDTDPPPDTFVQPANAGSFTFPKSDDGPPHLGEIIISLPQALKQADDKHTVLDRELSLLIIHGTLHLVGHDHGETAEAALMKHKEQIALDNLFPRRVNLS